MTSTAHRDPRIGRRTVVLLTVAAVAVLALVVAVALVVTDGRPTRSDPLPTLAQVDAPLAAAEPQSPEPFGGTVDAAPFVAAVNGALADPSLGSVGGVVVDVETGQVLVDREAAVARPPASTTKVLTAASALLSLGPDATFTTRVVSGSEPGDVVLVGGGDVTLTRSGTSPLYPGAATVADLAAAVRSAGVQQITRVVVDSSRYVGPAVAPEVTFNEGTTTVAPITPVMLDGGRVAPDVQQRSIEPDLEAGRSLAAALGSPQAEVVHGAAPTGARELGMVSSPPVVDLVHVMLLTSDNVVAEALGREAALRQGLPASFVGAAGALSQTALQVAGPVAQGVSLADASGLSRADRIPPSVVGLILVGAVREGASQLGDIVTSLPVAGYDGTLQDRFRSPPAAAAGGEVRAKTGRLRDVASLGGLVPTAHGRLVAFTFMDGTAPHGPDRSSAALDRAAAALATCACG